MAKQLKALVSNTHMEVYNHLWISVKEIEFPFLASVGTRYTYVIQTFIQAKLTYKLNKKMFKKIMW